MDEIFQDERFKKTCTDILKPYKNRPFLCTFMSVSFLAALEHDFPDRAFNVKTGDLFYKMDLLFKQEYDLNSRAADSVKEIRAEWDGHCWVELDDRYILDISLFRTVYSDQFSNACKQSVVDDFGIGRGLLIVDKKNPDSMKDFPFKRAGRSVLQENTLDGILNAIDAHQEYFFNGMN